MLELRLSEPERRQLHGPHTLRQRGHGRGAGRLCRPHADRLNEGLRAPIDEGQIVGTLTYAAPDGTVVTGMLSAERAMEARPEHATVYDVLPFLLPLEPFFSSGWAWVALVAVLVLIFALLLRRAHKKAALNRRRTAVYRAKRPRL